MARADVIAILENHRAWLLKRRDQNAVGISIAQADIAEAAAVIAECDAGIAELNGAIEALSMKSPQ